MVPVVGVIERCRLLLPNVARRQASARDNNSTDEQLNLEIAGRLSQFGTWARANLLQVDNKGQYQFSAAVNKAAIEKAIDDLAAAPKSPEPGNNLHLHEVFTEFHRRNLISLYVELNFIVQKALEEACNCSISKSRENLGATDAEVKPAAPVSAVIRKQSQALLNFEWAARCRPRRWAREASPRTAARRPPVAIVAEDA
jgi:hypothetical protein